MDIQRALSVRLKQEFMLNFKAVLMCSLKYEVTGSCLYANIWNHITQKDNIWPIGGKV